MTIFGLLCYLSLVVIIIRYHLIFKENPDKLSLTDYLEVAKPGDLILYGNNNIVHQFFIGTPYTHIALVYDTDNSELMVNTEQLKTWILNKDNVSIRILDRPLTSEQKNTIRIKMNENTNFIESNVFNNCLSFFDNKDIHYLEYLGNVMKNIDLWNKDTNVKCVFPLHFTSKYDSKTIIESRYSTEYLLTI